MFAFSMFICERTAPIGNDTTYLKDEKVSIDEIKLTPLCGIQGIVSMILFLQFFSQFFPPPFLLRFFILRPI